MHVCYINPKGEFYSPISGGAVATVTMEHARELLRRGHEVSVLSVAGPEELYDVGHVVKMPAVDRTNVSFPLRRLSGLRRRIHGWDEHFYEYYRRSFSEALRGLPRPPDAVIVSNDLVSPRYIKAIVPSAKVIVWLHNEQRTNQRSIEPVIRHVDAFMCNSDYIRHWTAREHNIPAEKLHTVYFGIDQDRFTPRRDFLSAPKTLRVICLGRIDPNKGADIAVDAVAELRKDGAPIEVTVAGGVWFYKRPGDDADPYLVSLKEKLSAAGGDYLGHVPRSGIPDLLRSHDVACVLSRSNEPFGLVTLESMACGCAVIASNRGGLPEACGGAAILVDPDDFLSVVHSLKSLSVNPQLLLDYKRRSIARAARATWSASADALEQVLAKCGALEMAA
jgi:glycosyltransferase involved in cell wall biosynthesis